MLSLDRKALKDAFKNVCELTNTVLTLFDNNKNHVFAYGTHTLFLCHKIRAAKELEDKCNACNRLGLSNACQRRGGYIYRCHMGLTEAVSPIIRNNEIIGYIMLGKVAEVKNIPFIKQQIHSCCEKYDLPEAELLKSIDEIPLVTRETVSGCTNILNMLSSYLLINNIIDLKAPPLNAQIDSYITKNLNGDLSVKALCSHFGISKTKLYRISVDSYSRGISEHIKTMRIEKAKELLRGDLNVTQVAEAVGIPDSNYFIKVFKKQTGYTPLKYKKSLKKTTVEEI